MAASEDNIKIEIERASVSFLDKLDAWRRKNDHSKESIQERTQLVKEYHTSLQSIQSDSSDKFKLAVKTLETLSGKRYSRFEHSLHCSWILYAEQDLNQYLLSTALRQRASEIFISQLEKDNEHFFDASGVCWGDEEYEALYRIAGELENYYASVRYGPEGFAEVVNLFCALTPEKRSKFCIMVCYADVLLLPLGQPANNKPLSAKLISEGWIPEQQIPESLAPLLAQLDHADSSDYEHSNSSGDGRQHFSDDEENDSGCWPAIPETPCLGAVIDDMPPQAQLGAAFCLFAVGALTATAGVLLALVLVHSIIPSLGITSPLAIGGCVAAAVGVVSGVALMGASIKMAQNAFTLFKSSDRVEKASTQSRNCLWNLFC